MNTKNKRKKIMLIIIVLSILLISILVATTYSKYISQVRGSGDVKVADWQFRVNGEESNITKINLAQTYTAATLKEGTIAPGTEGKFNILVDATGSEVGVEYNVRFENETTKPTNLKFIYNNTTVNSLTELENVLKGQISANEETKTRNMEIKWVWEYETGADNQIENNDKIDTLDATNIENFTFDIIVEGTQIEPQV